MRAKRLQCLTPGVDQQGRIVILCVDGRDQSIPGLFTRNRRAAMLQCRHRFDDIRRRLNQHGVIAAFTPPALDLAGAKLGDGLQIGQRFTLDFRPVNLDDKHPGQGHNRCQKNK